MKNLNHFADFLRDTVNLNRTRLDDLENSVEAIQKFIRDSDWEPRVWKFEEQGSWAHGTIIKPVPGGEYDADLLAVVEPVEGWSASEYVKTLGGAFKASGVYKDKAKVWDYCVTVTYAGDRKIDIAPCVRGRLVKDRLEVCNRAADRFERTEPILYTDWIREKNGYTGSNSFRKTTRLIKYLRDIRRDFNCPSVVLTTLLADQVNWNDKDSEDFADTPTTLKTLFGRLDDYLQARPSKPRIVFHALAEDLAAGMSQEDYETLRTTVHRLRGLIDEAYDTQGTHAGITAWRKVFGDEFAKGAEITAAASIDESAANLRDLFSSTAAHSDRLVDVIRQAGRWLWSPGLDRPAHMRPPPWPRAEVVSDRVHISAVWLPHQHAPAPKKVGDFDELPANGGLWFDVSVNEGQSVPPGHTVWWRITNTGSVALGLKKGRGGFEACTSGTRRWEPLEYRGVHLSEAFILRDRDRVIVGQSAPFHVFIV
jgi:hypothetical protein